MIEMYGRLLEIYVPSILSISRNNDFHGYIHEAGERDKIVFDDDSKSLKNQLQQGQKEMNVG